MKLILNGKSLEVEGITTIADLLILQKVKNPEMVSVEFNGNILDRADFEQTKLSENDQIEFLFFMGGGGC